MSPRALMIAGAAFGLPLMLASAVVGGAPFEATIFATGALFGKGYGIWEERSRRP